MAKFLVIREGPTPKTSEPIFATSDPELIAAVAQCVSARLGAIPARRRKRPTGPSIALLRPKRGDTGVGGDVS
jgi:hypothetical protein